MKKKLDLLSARWGGFISPLIVVGATNADKQNAKEVAADTRARANAYTKTGAYERLSALVDAALALPVATPADITALFGRKYFGSSKTVDGPDLKDAMVKDWNLPKAPTLRFMSTHNQWGPALTPMQIRACISAKLLSERLDRMEAFYKSTQPQDRGESGGIFGTPFLGGAMALLLLMLSWLPVSAQELAPTNVGYAIPGSAWVWLLACVVTGVATYFVGFRAGVKAHKREHMEVMLAYAVKLARLTMEVGRLRAPNFPPGGVSAGESGVVNEREEVILRKVADNPQQK